MGWRGYLISIIALIAGPGLVMDNLNNTKERKQIASHDKSAQGIIESGESSSGRRSSNYEFEVSFQPEGKGMRRKTFKVNSAFFKSRTSDVAITDPMVTVVYNPGNPDEAYLEGSKADSIPLWIGVLVSLAGLGGLIYGVTNRGGD